MEQTQVAGNKYRPPEWTIYVLAVVADLLVAAGVIPSAHLTLFRSGALFLLHRDWFLGVACGFLLPQAVPLTLVCFLKHQWEAFKLAAKARLTTMAETAQEHVADVTAAAAATSGEQATGNGASHSRRSRRQAEGEVSGYDVSNVSSDEVVELSSWTPESTSSSSGPGVRRRGALR